MDLKSIFEWGARGAISLAAQARTSFRASWDWVVDFRGNRKAPKALERDIRAAEKKLERWQRQLKDSEKGGILRSDDLSIH